jgi:hypothetical protein
VPDILCKGEWGVLERQAKGRRGAGDGDGEGSYALTLFVRCLSQVSEGMMQKNTNLGTPEIYSRITASTIPDLSREEIRVGAILSTMSAKSKYNERGG